MGILTNAKKTQYKGVYRKITSKILGHNSIVSTQRYATLEMKKDLKRVF